MIIYESSDDKKSPSSIIRMTEADGISKIDGNCHLQIQFHLGFGSTDQNHFDHKTQNTEDQRHHTKSQITPTSSFNSNCIAVSST
jgi:hypothetical protein